MADIMAAGLLVLDAGASRRAASRWQSCCSLRSRRRFRSRRNSGSAAGSTATYVGNLSAVSACCRRAVLPLGLALLFALPRRALLTLRSASFRF